MGVGDAAALADGAEDVDLMLVVAGLAVRGLVGADGVAHGLAVDGDGLAVGAAGGMEALQGAIELGGVDAHQDVADDVLAGHLAAGWLSVYPFHEPPCFSMNSW